ncbi:hypothetical protein RFI_15542 [Reticulomyxa filosa]|uniref:Uncharacterized protein n=1 Tax=Reticulomyxa filosa TaxID=46433 RepID=X6N7D1_RETFI|nr:hypothetical protein RFI_15542 [Reticulomyxa filosa]|eukprot:ETO21664.1 hypothetical protein RFI_15542 [Reticulomyxa filosa]
MSPSVCSNGSGILPQCNPGDTTSSSLHRTANGTSRPLYSCLGLLEEWSGNTHNKDRKEGEMETKGNVDESNEPNDQMDRDQEEKEEEEFVVDYGLINRELAKLEMEEMKKRQKTEVGRQVKVGVSIADNCSIFPLPVQLQVPGPVSIPLSIPVSVPYQVPLQWNNPNFTMPATVSIPFLPLPYQDYVASMPNSANVDHHATYFTVNRCAPALKQVFG